MTVFLTERCLPGLTLESLAAVRQAALLSSRQFTARGKPVCYLRCIYIPGDVRVLCFFEADDATHVRDVNEAAELPFTRIVEAVEFAMSDQA